MGVQGALLSIFVEPIYFSSIILGSLYHGDHLSRAMYQRIANIEDLPPLYMLNKPLLSGKYLGGRVTWHLPWFCRVHVVRVPTPQGSSSGGVTFPGQFGPRWPRTGAVATPEPDASSSQDHLLPTGSRRRQGAAAQTWHPASCTRVRSTPGLTAGTTGAVDFTCLHTRGRQHMSRRLGGHRARLLTPRLLVGWPWDDVVTGEGQASCARPVLCYSFLLFPAECGWLTVR